MTRLRELLALVAAAVLLLGAGGYLTFFRKRACRHRGARPVVDCDRRDTYWLCPCGATWRDDFQASITSKWIGYCDPPHTCPKCSGWKRSDWRMCANTVCELNPDYLRESESQWD
jgi:hypothetical protein